MPSINFAEIAQSVEQWTENPRVDGSIPSLGTRKSEADLFGQPFFVSRRPSLFRYKSDVTVYISPRPAVAF